VKSTLAGIRQLNLPYGAAPGAAQIMIGPNVPAELTAFYAAQGPVVAAVIFHGNSGTSFGYHFFALIDESPAGALCMGTCLDTGVVREDAIFPGTTANQTFAAVALDFDTGPGAAGEDWHDVGSTLGYLNGWHDFGGGTIFGEYRKIAAPPRCVQMAGCIAPGTKADGTKLFILPAGYRPVSEQFFPACGNVQNGAGAAPLQIDVDTDGSVYIFGANNASLTNVEFGFIYTLDG
jgi:hypothetical protein